MRTGSVAMPAAARAERLNGSDEVAEGGILMDRNIAMSSLLERKETAITTDSSRDERQGMCIPKWKVDARKRRV